jgi:hypothetical protein
MVAVQVLFDLDVHLPLYDLVLSQDVIQQVGVPHKLELVI